MKLPIRPRWEGYHLSRPRDPWDAFLKQKPVVEAAQRRGISKRNRANDTAKAEGRREKDEGIEKQKKRWRRFLGERRGAWYIVVGDRWWWEARGVS